MKQLLNKILGKNKQKYKLIIDKESENRVCVEITSGRYRGVVYKYGRVSLGDKSTDQAPVLQFQYEIVENPRNIKEDTEFHSFIGDILVVLMKEEMSSAIKFTKENHEARNDHPDQSVEK